MVRWLGRAVRGVLMLLAVGCIAAATPLGAQQAADSAALVTTTATPASAPATAHAVSTDSRGPRLSREWWSAEPAFPARNESRSTTAVAGTHTLTVTTLALVLIVIIAVLLIAD